MIQTVAVSEVKNGVITVGCSESACQGCHSETFCNRKGTTYEVSNPDDIPLEAGDFVVIEIPEGKAVFTIVMSLLFPLLMFLPGYFVGKALTDNEVLMALTGFAFIGLGFLVSWIFFRGRRKEYSPYILRKL